VKTIAFIPARGGSKSIPLKNIKLFCGKPLIYWVLKALESVKNIDEIYVATDSKEISETVETFDFNKVRIYQREEENAQDHSSTESVMLEFLNKHNLGDDDLFVLVQATCPLMQPIDIASALDMYVYKKPDSVLSCARIKHLLWDVQGQTLNYNYEKRPRRQDFQGSFMENGAFYINTIGNIKENRNRLSGRIMIYEMPEYTAIDIDESDDWIIAENLMKKHILYPSDKNLSNRGDLL
jgi:CMP-N-acetylneuraminic acid synthetase